MAAPDDDDIEWFGCIIHGADYSVKGVKRLEFLFIFGKCVHRGGMQKSATADIAIFGGGIAGLWLLNRLRTAGYSALLFESGALGGGQTNKAQGIIHGGMK